MKCIICNKINFLESINSYKHFWYYCRSCKNIFSLKKFKNDNYMFSLFIKFLSLLFKKEQLNKLLLSTNSKGEDFYSYYKKILKDDKKDKWDNHDKKFNKYLRKNKINLNNKKILSISDEPGYLSILLKKYTKKITFSALNKDVAEIMSKKFNIKTKKYNFNKDKLSDTFKTKYDLIFFRSTINFNVNFENIIKEISKISKKNTICIFNFHSVSISSCLMWMFDDYTLKCLIDLNYIKKLFKNKFKILKKYKIKINPRKHYYNNIFKKIFY